jgi:hypothetical protein
VATTANEFWLPRKLERAQDSQVGGVQDRDARHIVEADGHIAAIRRVAHAKGFAACETSVHAAGDLELRVIDAQEAVERSRQQLSVRTEIELEQLAAILLVGSHARAIKHAKHRKPRRAHHAGGEMQPVRRETQCGDDLFQSGDLAAQLAGAGVQ